MDLVSRAFLRVMAWTANRFARADPAGERRREAWNAVAAAHGAPARRPGHPSGRFRSPRLLTGSPQACTDVLELRRDGVPLRLEAFQASADGPHTLAVAPYVLGAGPRFDLRRRRPRLDVLMGGRAVREGRGDWRGLLDEVDLRPLGRLRGARLFAEGPNVVVQWRGLEADPARLEAAIGLLVRLARRDADRLRAVVPPDAEWTSGDGSWDRWRPPRATLRRQGVGVRVAPRAFETGPGLRLEASTDGMLQPFRIEPAPDAGGVDPLEPTERARFARSGASCLAHDGSHLWLQWHDLPDTARFDAGLAALLPVAERARRGAAYR
ncbi:MAG TPA: hypothetical protein RMH99_24990 [Sandaracinaceae bacterium LLY-WYZ-13_1]|nr:hypothetical protein [Sandaracinaceae bacterium LLY-WYZ-13_1]